MSKVLPFRYFHDGWGLDINLPHPVRAKVEVEDTDQIVAEPAPPEPLSMMDDDTGTLIFEHVLTDLKWRIRFSGPSACGNPDPTSDYVEVRLTEARLRELYEKLGELLKVVDDGIPGYLERLPDGTHRILMAQPGVQREKFFEFLLQAKKRYSPEIVQDDDGSYRMTMSDANRLRMLEDRRKVREASERMRAMRANWIADHKNYTTAESPKENTYDIRLPAPVPDDVRKSWEEVMREAWEASGRSQSA